MAQPARVALSLGSTRRLTEFDFSKISLSLERDLAPAENPLDGFRGIHALLSKALVELQVGPKTQQTGNGTHVTGANTGVNAPNGTAPPSPAGLKPSHDVTVTIEVLRERLAKWLDKVEVTSTLNGFAVKPRHFLLRPTWEEIDASLRCLGAKWVRQEKGVGSWIVPS